MSIVAVIPARAGSKRVPRKNIRLLCGKPLLAWSIETALAAACFSRIIVSTDSAEIADIAAACGAEVPWLRSVKNASDESSAVDVVLELLEQLERSGDGMPKAVMLLQPTSPFRSVESIHRAVELFSRSGGESVVSVSAAASHPYWCKQISPRGELLPFLPQVDVAVRSQDLPAVYALNGLIYLASVETICERKSLYSGHTQALLVESQQEAVDIDTPFDWLVAEALCRVHQEGGV